MDAAATLRTVQSWRLMPTCFRRTIKRRKPSLRVPSTHRTEAINIASAHRRRWAVHANRRTPRQLPVDGPLPSPHRGKRKDRPHHPQAVFGCRHTERTAVRAHADVSPHCRLAVRPSARRPSVTRADLVPRPHRAGLLLVGRLRRTKLGETKVEVIESMSLCCQSCM